MEAEKAAYDAYIVRYAEHLRRHPNPALELTFTLEKRIVEAAQEAWEAARETLETAESAVGADGAANLAMTAAHAEVARTMDAAAAAEAAVETWREPGLDTSFTGPLQAAEAAEDETAAEAAEEDADAAARDARDAFGDLEEAAEDAEDAAEDAERTLRAAWRTAMGLLRLPGAGSILRDSVRALNGVSVRAGKFRVLRL